MTRSVNNFLLESMTELRMDTYSKISPLRTVHRALQTQTDNYCPFHYKKERIWILRSIYKLLKGCGLPLGHPQTWVHPILDQLHQNFFTFESLTWGSALYGSRSFMSRTGRPFSSNVSPVNNTDEFGEVTSIIFPSWQHTNR